MSINYINCCLHTPDCCNKPDDAYIADTSLKITQKQTRHSGKSYIHKQLAHCYYCQSEQCKPDIVRAQKLKQQEKLYKQRQRLKQAINNVTTINTITTTTQQQQQSIPTLQQSPNDITTTQLHETIVLQYAHINYITRGWSILPAQQQLNVNKIIDLTNNVIDYITHNSDQTKYEYYELHFGNTGCQYKLNCNNELYNECDTYIRTLYKLIDVDVVLLL